MQIAVIGAGLAGLGAARELTRAGHEVTVFEKSRGLGGRLASRRVQIDGHTLVFDHGAQNIKAPGSALDELARELLPPGDIVPIPQSVYLHDGTQIMPGDSASNTEPKWTCRGGITALPKAMAQGLDIRLNTRVELLSEGDRTNLQDDTGTWLGEFDRVILTAPAPQASELTRFSDLPYAYTEANGILDTVKYHNCLSVMLWFQAPLDAPWYALLAADRTHPLLWLARGNLGGESAPGTALVAQLGPEISKTFYDVAEESIVRTACQRIAELLGPDFEAPDWSAVMRWRYAQPDTTVDFDAVNPAGSKVIICGDALAGGKAHLAYDSGLRAAGFLMNG